MSRQLPARRALVVAALLALALAGCRSTSSALPPVFIDPVSPAQRLAQVDALANSVDDELSVQPLRDPQVEDLREQARHARDQGDLAQAISALEHALSLLDSDPALLQERAELALLAADPRQAEDYARRALDLGSRTGPLCRRHWATIWQARQAREEAINADSAHAQIEGCTVPPIQRF